MTKENAVQTKRIKATAMWAFTTKVNDMSGKYQVDLCNIDAKAVEALEELGIDVKKNKDKPEKGFYITCKSNHPIRAYDADGAEMKDVLIGNGSAVVATIQPYSWTFKNKKGISASLKKLVISELVEYNPDGADEDDEDDEVL